MKRNHLTLNVFFLIVLTDVGESVAQIFFKKGLIETGIGAVSFGNLWTFVAANASSAYVWLGMFCFLMNFLVWMAVLSRVDFSVAFPVGSTSYIFVPILAMLFLGESVSPVRWFGIILIVAGIHFVSKSAKAAKAG